MRDARGRGNAGFTVIELVIVLTMLIVVSGVMVNSLGSLKRFADTGSSESELQVLADRALLSIIADMRRSGFVEQGGVDFPHLFTDGEAEDPFDLHAHVPAAKYAVAGDLDFGPNREIVFLMPADADGDGSPDVDGGGNLAWDATAFSYVVNTGQDGINYLERRTDGADPEVISHHVERIVFDDNASSGFEVPLRAIRVRIDFRLEDEGRLYRHTTEATVRLRNGV